MPSTHTWIQIPWLWITVLRNRVKFQKQFYYFTNLILVLNTYQFSLCKILFEETLMHWKLFLRHRWRSPSTPVKHCPSSCFCPSFYGKLLRAYSTLNPSCTVRKIAVFSQGKWTKNCRKWFRLWWYEAAFWVNDLTKKGWPPFTTTLYTNFHLVKFLVSFALYKL